MSHELSTDDAALIRQTPSVAVQYLSYVPPTIVLSGTISEVDVDADNGNVVMVIITGVVGDWGDASPGYLIWFGSTPGGRDLSVIRLRDHPALDGSDVILPIAETSPGQAHLYDGAYVSVIAFRRPHAKIPRLTKITDPDSGYTVDFNEYHDYDRSYTNENLYVQPQANITRDGLLPFQHAGFLDVGEVYRTVQLNATQSSPITGSIVSYLWDVGDGTLLDDSDNPVATVRVPEGFRWMSLTVTTDEGAVHTRFFPVWAHGDAYPPVSDIHITRDERSEWREMDVDISLFSDDEAPNIIPGTTVAVWEVVTYDGDAPPDQRVTEFIGWIPKSILKVRTDASTWQMTIVGPGGWLQAMAGFGQLLMRPLAAPTRWSEMSDLTVNKVGHYILREYSNILDLVNLYMPVVVSPVEEEEIKPADQWSQLVYQLSAYQGAVGCDSGGAIWFAEQPFYVSEPTDLDDWETVIHLDEDDWTFDNGLDVPREQETKVSTMSMGGSFFDGIPDSLGVESHQLLAVGPGDAPSSTGSATEGPYQRLDNVTPQAQLNQRVGREWTRVNSPWPKVTLELVDDLDVIEPAWRALIYLHSTQLTAGDTVVHNKPFVVTSVSIAHSFDRGSVRRVLTLELEAVVVGQDGATVPVPPLDPPADWTPPPSILPPGLDTPIMPPNTGALPTKLIITDSVGAGCHVALSWNPLLLTLDYDAVTGLTGTNTWLWANNWNYDEYRALQSTGLYKSAAPFAGTPFSLLHDNAALFGSSSRIGKVGMGSINRNGYEAIMCGTHFIYTEDSWATFNDVNIPWSGGSFYQTALDNTIGFIISPYNNGSEGWIYAWFPTSELWKSENWGATWAIVPTSASAFDIGELNIPYIRIDGVTPNINDAQQELYMTGSSANNSWVVISQTAGLSFDLTQWSIGASGGFSVPLYGSLTGAANSTFTWDGSKISLAAGKNGTDASFWRTLISNHSGDHAQPFTDTDFGGVSDAYGQHCNRYPTNDAVTLAFNRFSATFYATDDDGAAWQALAAPVGYGGVSNVQWKIEM